MEILNQNSTEVIGKEKEVNSISKKAKYVLFAAFVFFVLYLGTSFREAKGISILLLIIALIMLNDAKKKGAKNTKFAKYTAVGIIGLFIAIFLFMIYAVLSIFN